MEGSSYAGAAASPHWLHANLTLLVKAGTADLGAEVARAWREDQTGRTALSTSGVS